MKLIIREYIESLREREELDAILPDLLSEMGFTVYARPKRGATEHGVDVAAVGRDEDGERKVFLLAIKRGSITRQEWHANPQGLRATLDQIQDVYLQSRLPKRYRELKVVICLCFGGYIETPVRADVTGYTQRHTNEKVSFTEWNGDHIAGMLLQGLLREGLIPRELRGSFQKAVAMVDEPEVSYRHFASMASGLRALGVGGGRARLRAGRQLYICLWILFVWSREADNVEAPYRASELTLLTLWELIRPLLGKPRGAEAKAFSRVLSQAVELHLLISDELVSRKVLPFADRRHALSMAVRSRTSADINLKLFDLLGRIALTGLWYRWLAQLASGREGASEADETANRLLAGGLNLIRNNPCLGLPLCDDQATDVALFLLLASSNPASYAHIAGWLAEMAGRLDFAVRTHGPYPCVFREYREIAAHPRERSTEYLEEAAAGSTLIPLLSAWLPALGGEEEIRRLVELKRERLQACTLQLWLPDETSEEGLYTGDREHGVALTDLPLSQSGEELLERIDAACKKQDAFRGLSALRASHWPIVLVACRHFRLPVPPQFWLSVVRRESGAPEGASSA